MKIQQRHAPHRGKAAAAKTKTPGSLPGFFAVVPQSDQFSVAAFLAAGRAAAALLAVAAALAEVVAALTPASANSEATFCAVLVTVS